MTEQKSYHDALQDLLALAANRLSQAELLLQETPADEPRSAYCEARELLLLARLAKELGHFAEESLYMPRHLRGKHLNDFLDALRVTLDAAETSLADEMAYERTFDERFLSLRKELLLVPSVRQRCICQTCAGKGEVLLAGGEFSRCSNCGGKGFIADPFRVALDILHGDEEP